MLDKVFGHYRVLEEIGAGGMGVVYRAYDERLDRDVALKVLPAGILTDESARKRFRKEALALAKLNHTNIAAVYDFDSQDGVDFLAMEFIPGTTLSQTLLAGAVPEKELARLGVQLAEGLAAAHAQGVVHRDLKPGNLRITPDGQLKILDFGLARMARPESEADVTESVTDTHAAAGTLPYMAPEQLQGEATDARSDIYAAGVVLYEMATGRRPFPEKLSTKLVNDILHTPPPAPGRLKPDISPKLEEVILKCLEKEPENRYQSAKELAVDVRRLSAPSTMTQPIAAQGPRRGMRTALAAGASLLVLAVLLVGLNVGGWRTRLLRLSEPAARIESLAVLPLENLSHDPAQEYFAEGMTEELITNLSKISALRVISRTSVMRYKDTKKPLPEIARELNVDAIIEGSVLRAGDRVRITAQLIRAVPEQHLWANSYDRDLRDILALHSEVARAIAGEIRVTLTPQEHARLTGARPVDPEAYEAYLRGRLLSRKFNREAAQKAVQYLAQAVERDPTFALAFANLAHAYIKAGQFAKAKAAAQKALEIDDHLGEAHTYLGVATFFADLDVATPLRETKRGIELSPNSADVLMHGAIVPMFEGNKTETLALLQRALELEPIDFEVNLMSGEIFTILREYDRSIEQLHKVLELDAVSARAYSDLADVYEMKGMEREAAAAYEKSRALSGANPQELVALRHAFDKGGINGLRRWRLEKLKEAPRGGVDSPMAYVWLYAALGQKEQAFAWLEKVYQQHGLGILFLKLDPRLDSLRSDPRFQELLKRVDLLSKQPPR
jgi:serine/threonine protein kinase/Flp pilus assembly protein TadD